MKRYTKFLILFIVIILLLVFAFSVFRIQDIILKKIYPKKYSEFVYKYAQEYDIDPLLVFAIIKAESNFNPNIVSSSGAIGIMQLMDSTAEEIAGKLEINFMKGASLYNPELNIQLGTKYFSELIKEYNGNYLLAVTSYNAGIGNVKKWIEQGTINKEGTDLENIPYKETNNYVRKIVRDYKIYKNLYEK